MLALNQLAISSCRTGQFCGDNLLGKGNVLHMAHFAAKSLSLFPNWITDKC